MDTTYPSERIFPARLHTRRPSAMATALVVSMLALVAATAVSRLTRAPGIFTTPPPPAPQVPARLGGIGFEHIADDDGWQTGTIAPGQFHLFADTNAIKGGTITIGIDEFPLTFRPYGRDVNMTTGRMVYDMVYETLLTTNPLDLSFLPSLASHWKISSDGRTFTFRIDPAARFSDGHPVTSEDVIATWKLGIDPGIGSESTNQFFQEFEKPVAISPYIVSVTSHVHGWKNLLYFSGVQILPAHVIGRISGRQYLERFRYRTPPGSGPYILEKGDLKEGREVTIRRRADWWRRDLWLSRGQYNFDAVRVLVVGNEDKGVGKFLQGKLDFCATQRAEYALGEFQHDEVDRGLLISRRIYNDHLPGFAGIAFNTRRPPLDDIRIRQAVALLFNREKLVEHAVNYDFEPINSIYPLSEFENPNNPKQTYDPERARALLADAGYRERNDRGILVRDGVPLELEMLIYPGQKWTMEMLQSDLQEEGIGLTLQTTDQEIWFSMLQKGEFQMGAVQWGGLVFPNPKTSIHSSLADRLPSNNVTGFRNARVDELIEKELTSFDPIERRMILREIDSLFGSSWHYAYSWVLPYTQMHYANRFGMPEFVVSRFGGWQEALWLWWVDPRKDADLKKARTDRSFALDGPDARGDDFWRRWKKGEE